MEDEADVMRGSSTAAVPLHEICSTISHPDRQLAQWRARAISSNTRSGLCRWMRAQTPRLERGAIHQEFLSQMLG